MWETCPTEYIKNIVFEKDGNVGVWWFSRDFSQSRLGDRNSGKGSNACTLIALLVAAKCHYKRIQIWSYDVKPLNCYLVKAFADSIVEGNEIHERLHKAGSLVNVNLTVPEAIAAGGYRLRHIAEWKSLVYMISLSSTLYDELSSNVKEWFHSPLTRRSDLYVVLITENRTVIIVFQEAFDTVSLIDSHQHLPYGALVSQVASKNLKCLCNWYCNMLSKLYGLNPDCYELSFLYFKSSSSASSRWE